jgi:hypothetical protein
LPPSTAAWNSVVPTIFWMARSAPYLNSSCNASQRPYLHADNSEWKEVWLREKRNHNNM